MTKMSVQMMWSDVNLLWSEEGSVGDGEKIPSVGALGIPYIARYCATSREPAAYPSTVHVATRRAEDVRLLSGYITIQPAPWTMELPSFFFLHCTATARLFLRDFTRHAHDSKAIE